VTRQRRGYTIEDICSKQRRASLGLATAGLHQAATLLRSLRPEEYARTKCLDILPKKEGNKMTGKARQQLLEDINYWRERAETAEEKLDQINAITVEEAGISAGEDQELRET